MGGNLCRDLVQSLHVVLVHDDCVLQLVGGVIFKLGHNPVEGCDFKRPPQETIRKFTSELLAAGISATLRQEKGGNIDAACGQLRLRKMKDLSEK